MFFDDSLSNLSNTESSIDAGLISHKIALDEIVTELDVKLDKLTNTSLCSLQLEQNCVLVWLKCYSRQQPSILLNIRKPIH